MTTTLEAPARTRLDRLADIGITRGVLALCLLWLVAVGPLVHEMTAQGAPRLALTGAIYDDHDIKIDGYKVGFDFTERDGHLYSDKAPGQEVLALPAYAAARAVGAEPAVVTRVKENATLWWLTFWSAGLPAVALILMAAVASHRRGTPIPLPALGTLTFGTMLLPFAANLYGHVLSAAIGYAAWLVLDRSSAGWRRGALAGTLVGLAVCTEYPLAIVGVALAVLLVRRRHWSSLVAMAAAGIPWALALGLYQDKAFGSPMSSGYTSKKYHQGATLFITGVPKPTTGLAMLFGSRGLLLFTPVVAVGLWGLYRRWRDTHDEGALVAMIVSAGFLLLQAGWVNAWGGGGPGPRYVIPMLPFLAIGLAHSWTAVRPPIRRFVAGISLVSMILPTLTFHLISDGSIMVGDSLRRLLDYGINPSIWSIGIGPAGYGVWAVTSLAALAFYVRTARGEAADAPAAVAEPISS